LAAAHAETERIAVSHLHLKLTLTLILAFTLLVSAARTLGGMQPPSPALEGFSAGCEGKSQPCWHGIVPGVTDVHEVYRLMAFAGEPDLNRSIFSRDYILTFALSQNQPYCWASFEFVNDILVRGAVSMCDQTEVRLGDLALLHQQEEKIVSLPPHEQIYGRVSVNISGWPTLFSRIDYVNLLAPNARFQHFPWLGFISQSRYCQLVPDYPLCP
jgi:hypothetical protein